MESFFDRVSTAWPAGRRDLHWHLLPSSAEAAALSAPYAQLVDHRPGLAPVPAAWMHCTLLHAVGLGAEDLEVDALVDAVARPLQGVSPFDLVFDRPAVGAVAVEVSGWPGAPFDQLAGMALTATATAAPGFRPSVSRYPYISLAYTTEGAEDLEAADLCVGLAAVEGPLSSTVHVDRMYLVEQVHDGRHLTWRTLAQVPLADAG